MMTENNRKKVIDRRDNAEECHQLYVIDLFINIYSI